MVWRFMPLFLGVGVAGKRVVGVGRLVSWDS